MAEPNLIGGLVGGLLIGQRKYWRASLAHRFHLGIGRRAPQFIRSSMADYRCNSTALIHSYQG
jgi:hypothetical protein